MKRTKKKLSDTYLLGGLVMMIIGASGIGYIPGKTAVLTIMFTLVLMAGILITAAYAVSRKHRTGRISARPRKLTDVPERKKSYSQFAA